MRCLNLPTRKKRLLAPESDHESISCVRRGLGDSYGVDADTGDARVRRLNNKNICRSLPNVSSLSESPALCLAGMYKNTGEQVQIGNRLQVCNHSSIIRCVEAPV